MGPAAEPYDLLEGRGSGGEGARRALRQAEKLGDSLATALRRAVPFLGRRGIPVRFERAAVVPAHAHHDATYALCFEAVERGVGLLAFDRQVSALLVDGLLGGDGKRPPALEGERLSRVQVAFMRSASLQILAAMSEIVQRAHASALRPCEEIDAQTGGDGVAIGITLLVGFEAQVVVRLPVSLFGALDEHAPPRGPDPRVVATLFHAPVEVSVELGRTRMAMRKLMALQVGTTFVLDTTVDGRATVRVDGQVVAHGRPKTEAGYFAVRIESTHGAPAQVGTTFPLSDLEASPPPP